MTKSLLTIILASLLTLTACSPAADTKESSDVTPTEATTEATTEAPTEEVTEAPTEKSTETEIKDISDTKKQLTCYIDGSKVSGAIYLPKDDGVFPTVIMISGMNTTYLSLEEDAKKIAEEGIAVVTFDCRGYCIGHSAKQGKYTEISLSSSASDIMEITDIISVYPAIDKENIFIWGHSYGGLITSNAAAEKPDRFKGLIGVDPSYQMPDEYRLNYLGTTDMPNANSLDSSLTNSLKELVTTDIFEKLKSYKNNAVIITGTEYTIDTDYPEIFKKALESMPQAEKIVVDGADHGFTKHREELIQYTVDFIKENID